MHVFKEGFCSVKHGSLVTDTKLNLYVHVCVLKYQYQMPSNCAIFQTTLISQT